MSLFRASADKGELRMYIHTARLVCSARARISGLVIINFN